MNGLDATNRLPFQAFDCIVTDLKMPKKEGVAFYGSIRGNPLNSKTPVIIASGHIDKVNLEEGDGLYFLKKPFEFSVLVEMVGTQLKLGDTSQRVSSQLLNTFIQSGH